MIKVMVNAKGEISKLAHCRTMDTTHTGDDDQYKLTSIQYSILSPSSWQLNYPEPSPSKMV